MICNRQLFRVVDLEGFHMRKPKAIATMHTVPEPARRKLAAAYRKIATGRRFTPAERAEFARMADAWERTLPK
jgi:hypothetical protein